MESYFLNKKPKITKNFIDSYYKDSPVALTAWTRFFPSLQTSTTAKKRSFFSLQTSKTARTRTFSGLMDLTER
jgi:hypothetical protein